MSWLLVLAIVTALFVAAYALPCPCGRCGRPAGQHNPPRRDS